MEFSKKNEAPGLQSSSRDLSPSRCVLMGMGIDFGVSGISQQVWGWEMGSWRGDSCWGLSMGPQDVGDGTQTCLWRRGCSPAQKAPLCVWSHGGLTERPGSQVPPWEAGLKVLLGLGSLALVLGWLPGPR